MLFFFLRAGLRGGLQLHGARTVSLRWQQRVPSGRPRKVCVGLVTAAGTQCNPDRIAATFQSAGPERERTVRSKVSADLYNSGPVASLAYVSCVTVMGTGTSHHTAAKWFTDGAPIIICSRLG